MDFNFSETQKMLLDSAERLMEDKGGVEAWRARRALPGGFDETLWSQYAEMGWLALSIPEEHGGLACPFEDAALLHTSLGRHLDVSPIVSTAVLGVRLLTQAASTSRAAALLAGVAEGSVRLAIAHQEPEERFAPGAPRATAAERTPKGYVLSGVKRLAIDAPAATTLLVTARLAGEAGTALFAVDPSGPGVSLDGYPLVDGSHAADVRLDKAALGEDALLIPPASGIAAIEEAFDYASVASMAQGVGAMEACLTVCADYIKERRQFGQPIGKFQALQHMMADMFVATHQARSMLYQALSQLEAAPDERAYAVSSAKVVTGEAMQLVSRSGIQLHGGYGVTDEYAVSHFFRRMMALEKLHGDVAWHVARMGRALG